MSGPSKRSRVQVRAAKRQNDCARAVSLRAAGYTYREIAAAENISLQAAYDRTTDGLKFTASAMEKDSFNLRTLEAERLERMWKVLWPRAVEGNLDAIDRVMRLSMQRTRLLGLDVNQVNLKVDEPAVAALADIVVRHVGDPRKIALIRADLASFLMQNAQKALPAPSDVIEGEVREIE